MRGELTPLEINTLLMTQWVARLGCHMDGLTYVVPISYAYDGCSILGHSVEGSKLRMMRNNPEICVQVDRVEDLGNWQSVIAWGHFEELHGADAVDAANALLMRFAPLMTDPATQPGHGPPTISENMGATFFRIRLHTMTGRFETQSQS